MPQFTRLFSETTGTITGANDTIIYYHGLQENGTKVTPDVTNLQFTRSTESGGAGGAVATATFTFGALPVAGNTIIVGAETWTWAATRVQAYQIAIGSTQAICATNMAAAINADTFLNISASALVLVVTIQGSTYPGSSTTEFGSRTGALNLTGAAGAWNVANLNLGGGAGLVSGPPTWSVIASTTNFVKIRVRGMRAADSLSYHVKCVRFHSWMRAIPKSITFTGTVSTTLGSAVVTFSTLNPITAGVEVGDILVINHTVNPVNNGSYKITATSTTTVTVDATMKATLAGQTYGFNYGSALGVQETGIVQVPFDMPGLTAHTAAAPAANIDLPDQEVTTDEIADAAVTPQKCSFEISGNNDIWSCGYIYFTGNVTDAETVTTGTKIYEFDDGGGIGAGNVVVPMGGAGPWAANVAAVALAAAINGDATRQADAYNNAAGDTVTVQLMGNDVTTALALATTAVNGVVSAANLTAGAAKADKYFARSTYAVTAANVTKWALGATHEVVIGTINNPGYAPQIVHFGIHTAGIAGQMKSNATIAVRVVQMNADDYAILVRDPVAVLANTDVITWAVL